MTRSWRSSSRRWAGRRPRSRAPSPPARWVPTGRCSASGWAPTRRRPPTPARSRASARPRRRSGRWSTPSATRVAARRLRPADRSRPASTARPRRRSSPRDWTGSEAGAARGRRAPAPLLGDPGGGEPACRLGGGRGAGRPRSSAGRLRSRRSCRAPPQERCGRRAAGSGRADRRAACRREIARRLADAGTPTEGFEVQRIAPAGTELTVGAVGDPAFGPLVTCGAGGPAGELLGDVQIRLARSAAGSRRCPRSAHVPAARRLPGRPRPTSFVARHRHARRRAGRQHPAVAELISTR